MLDDGASGLPAASAAATPATQFTEFRALTRRVALAACAASRPCTAACSSFRARSRAWRSACSARAFSSSEKTATAEVVVVPAGVLRTSGGSGGGGGGRRVVEEWRWGLSLVAEAEAAFRLRRAPLPPLLLSLSSLPLSLTLPWLFVSIGATEAATAGWG